MKRMLIVALIVCLIFPACCAASDLTGMTDEELKAEFSAVVAELVSRGIWISDTIPAGLYIVGQSIPAGSYELTPLTNDTIEIFPTLEDMSSNHNRLMYLVFEENETFTLTLSDGMAFNLQSTCTIKPFGFSW